MARPSKGDGEAVAIDVMDGDRRREARNVTGLNGEPIEESLHAAHRCRLRSRQFLRRRQHRPFLNRQHSPSCAKVIEEPGAHF